MTYGQSNIDDVMLDLEAWMARFDFTMPGHYGSLGRDVAMAVVEGIQNRSNRDRRGATQGWRPNEPKYRKWKLRKYGIDEPNTRTGQMLSQLSLYGKTTIEPELVTMVYGTDTVTERAVFGGNHTASDLARDQKKTDTEKAYLAHTGQSVHKILRPFYELDDEITQDIRKLIERALTDYLGETKVQAKT
jgi:hypothetical protein